MRCPWVGSDPDSERYHDQEWGRPVQEDDRLYEKLCLEGFQSGLSWLTILRKREAFRAAFAGFEAEQVARFDAQDVERLLGDARIVRHRGKIEAAIGNARAAIAVRVSQGSLAAFCWQHEPPPRPALTTAADWPASTRESVALSKALRTSGFRFVGPTTVYAFMQAMGLVNDHLETCFLHDEVETERAEFARP